MKNRFQNSGRIHRTTPTLPFLMMTRSGIWWVAFCGLGAGTAHAQSITGTSATQTWNVQSGAVTGATANALPTTGTLTFGGTAGNVTVTNTGTGSLPTGITFATSSYGLLAGTTYTPLTASTYTVNSGVTATLGLAIAPAGNLNVNGTGSLVFSTNQTYTGSTQVSWQPAARQWRHDRHRRGQHPAREL
jgi:autotransporter-associated beta strand protein